MRQRIYIGWKLSGSKAEEFGVPPRSEESPLGEELDWLDWAQERPEERDIETGAEDAE